jgi:hypothetical protein
MNAAKWKTSTHGTKMAARIANSNVLSQRKWWYFHVTLIRQLPEPYASTVDDLLTWPVQASLGSTIPQQRERWISRFDLLIERCRTAQHAVLISFDPSATQNEYQSSDDQEYLLVPLDRRVSTYAQDSITTLEQACRHLQTAVLQLIENHHSDLKNTFASTCELVGSVMEQLMMSRIYESLARRGQEIAYSIEAKLSRRNRRTLAATVEVQLQHLDDRLADRRDHCSTASQKWMRKSLANVLRYQLGNPWKKITVPVEYQSGVALALARSIHENGGYHLMPMLADALEEAGCQDVDILSECRSHSVPHCPGYWLIDDLLNLEPQYFESMPWSYTQPGDERSMRLWPHPPPEPDTIA